MVIGLKDGVKLFGIAIVCACAVFVCTFFLNFYIDASAIRSDVPAEMLPLYEAQLLTAKFVCIISGCCLLLVAVVLLIFYIKLYVEGHAKQLGILKALGYGSGRIAAGFWVFGLSVLIGTLVGYGLGYAFMPTVYGGMGGDLPDIPIGFHVELLFGLVLLPALLFTGLSVLYAYCKLRRSANTLLRGGGEKTAGTPKRVRASRSFLTELAFETLRSRKMLAFFVAFGGFCFSSMLQMSASMIALASTTMAAVIMLIGIVLACTSLLLAFTALANANAKTVAVMRSYGYSVHKSGEAVLGAYRIPAYIGFGIGTAYQFGLLKIMVNVVFSDIGTPLSYSFDVAVFFIVLAVFAVLYECLTFFFTWKLGKRNVRSFVLE